jgi:hypothetical protein
MLEMIPFRTMPVSPAPLVSHLIARGAPLLALALTIACAPPAPREGPTPAAETVTIPTARKPPPAEAPLPAVSLPEVLPATVFTRIAPVSVVDERGNPLQVLTGHHTRLELQQVLRARSLVRCELCPTPVTGWVQTDRLMAADHQPSPEEWADERLALSLYAAELRQGLQAEGRFPGLQPSQEQQALLLRLLEQGFAREDRDAMAPASGGAYAREGAAIRLRLGRERWAVKSVEFPETGSGH